LLPILSRRILDELWQTCSRCSQEHPTSLCSASWRGVADMSTNCQMLALFVADFLCSTAVSKFFHQTSSLDGSTNKQRGSRHGGSFHLQHCLHVAPKTMVRLWHRLTRLLDDSRRLLFKVKHCRLERRKQHVMFVHHTKTVPMLGAHSCVLRKQCQWVHIRVFYKNSANGSLNGLSFNRLK
jgi:hypothetical protein